MKIMEVQISNILRLRQVSIKPDGTMTVLGGRNEQGKTSVMRSIEMAFNGGKSIPTKPVHGGAEKGEVVVHVGEHDRVELTVTKTIHPTGAADLRVRLADGSKKNQTWLEAFKPVTIDPVDWQLKSKTAKGRREQAEEVRKLAGVDFSALDDRRAGIYEDRAKLNAKLRDREGELAAMQTYSDAPAEEVSFSDLTERLKAANATNAENARVRDGLKALKELLAREEQNVKIVDEQRGEAIVYLTGVVERLKKELADAEKRLAEAQYEKAESIKAAEKQVEHTRQRVAKGEEHVAGLKDVDTSAIEQELANAEAINRKVRANKAREEARRGVAELNKAVATLTEQIERIDQEKHDLLAASKLPVEGLSFDDEGVMLNGIPTDAWSTAQTIRTLCLMAMANAGALRLLMIPSGAFLDQQNLKLIHDLAAERDFQVFVETVGDEGADIIIDDGEVVARKEGAAQ
jgi:recombinational DNA repair ATPase RecF